MIPVHSDPAAYAHIRNVREFGEIVCLLSALAHHTDGLPVDGLAHALQTAVRAERANAESAVIAVALLHDVGKVLSENNHPAIAAEILKGRVSNDLYEVLRTHGEFQHDRNHGVAETTRYARESWYDLAVQLAEWDHASFDPSYPTPPLSFFLPYVRKLYMGTDR